MKTRPTENAKKINPENFLLQRAGIYTPKKEIDADIRQKTVNYTSSSTFDHMLHRGPMHYKWQWYAVWYSIE